MGSAMRMLILMIVVLNMEIKTTCNCKENDYNLPCYLALSELENCQSLVMIHTNDSISIDETARAAHDFGGMYHHRPAAIVYPASVDDIVRVVRMAAMSDHLTVAARGNGHSINGQAQALHGIVVDMMSSMKGIHIFHGMGREETQAFVDVYAGELWVDVLKATITEGLSPRSWTDYLFLSVGGTLSNGGVSGQSFRFGPQISNVLQLEVVTGKGEVITCSPGYQEELFYGVLGGLGQFGIIIKARIVLQRAPHMKIESMLTPLSYIRGLNYRIDISYFDFLNRVYGEEISARATGTWDAPHPWLNLFIPKSQIARFDIKVVKRILKHGVGGPVLIYPLNRNKWDSRMSTAVPDEEIFYLVGLLRFIQPNPGGPNSIEMLLAENGEILGICEREGIEMKQYLPHYKTNAEWKKHFGRQWDQFVERKRKFDPRAILAPGQTIFSRSSDVI